MKSRKQTLPLLFMIPASMLCASLAAAVSSQTFFQHYSTEGWAQPVITVLMQGISSPKEAQAALLEKAGPGKSSLPADPDTLISAYVRGTEAEGLFSNGSLPGTGNPSDGSLSGAETLSGGCLSGAGYPSDASLSGAGNPSDASLSGTGYPSGDGLQGAGNPSGASLSKTGNSSGGSLSETGLSCDDGITAGTDPEPVQYEFTSVTPDYFDDALFIGDSRVVGVQLYSGWDNLTYYAESGMTVYNMFTCPADGSLSVEEALLERSFGKIYLEVGINEMGTGTADSFMDAYADAVSRLRELQPDAVIYLCGIMYVKQDKSEWDPIFNNPNIQERNEKISQLANGTDIFYLDINEAVTDETGNLNPAYTWDEVHLLGKYDVLWMEYFSSHAVVFPVSH